MTTGSGDFTVKEIVIEIRDAVQRLSAKVDRIDEQGSIGTRDILQDHERRLRLSEERLSQPPVTRQDLHAVKADIAALKLWQAGSEAVSTLKRGQLAIALAIGTFGSAIISSLITFYWLHHG